MTTDVGIDRVCNALEAVITLGMASPLDAEALLECLAITTANLRSWTLVQEHSLPDEIQAALRVYTLHLAEHTWQMIRDHDTGRFAAAAGEDAP